MITRLTSATRLSSVTTKWSVRVPEIEELENVLNEMSIDEWVIYKMGEPVRGPGGKLSVPMVFQKWERLERLETRT